MKKLSNLNTESSLNINNDPISSSSPKFHPSISFSNDINEYEYISNIDEIERLNDTGNANHFYKLYYVYI